MTTAEICKLLGLAPDSPPGKIREAVADLPPGPVLDEVACRGAGLEPEVVAVDGIVDYQETAHYTYSDPQAIYLPVSSDPAASHQLATAALEAGLGWPAVMNSEAGFVCKLQADPSDYGDPGEIGDEYGEVGFAFPPADWEAPALGTTPMHAAALAVALGARGARKERAAPMTLIDLSRLDNLAARRAIEAAPWRDPGIVFLRWHHWEFIHSWPPLRRISSQLAAFLRRSAPPYCPERGLMLRSEPASTPNAPHRFRRGSCGALEDEIRCTNSRRQYESLQREEQLRQRSGNRYLTQPLEKDTVWPDAPES